MEMPKRALTGGEVDPDLWQASDLNPVRVAAAKVSNMIVRQRGGVERTPGTEHLAMAKTAARVRLAPFNRSSQAAYLLEHGPGYVRIYDADMAAGDAMVDEVATPYAADDLIFLQWAQSNNVQWIFSGGPVKELIRFPLPSVSFGLVDARIENGPFLDENANKALTLSADGVTGVITLTASAALFQPGHVGAYFRLEERDEITEPLWLPEVPAVNLQIRRFNGRAYRSLIGGTTGTSAYPPEHEVGIRNDGNGVNWEYLHSGFGIVRVTGYSSPTSVTCTVIKRLPEALVTANTWRWREGAFSGVRGYPTTGALYKNALWMAGTPFEPYRLHKSAIDGFNDFEPGVLDDSALTRDLVDGATEAVRWLCPAKVMMIGTDGPEWVARPDQTGDTVRVNNLITEPATNEGSSEIPGLAVGNRTIFTDAGRRRLLSTGFDLRSDGWTPADLSLLAAHILGPGVIETCYQRNPWPLIWCLLEDGTLAALTYLPEQDVLAWHRHNVGDPIESIAVLKVEGGRRETLFMAVRRDGLVQIERMFDRHRPEIGQGIADAQYLQAAVTYDLGVPATVFAGLDHLEGREVIALVDGNSHPPVTVTGGVATLNFAGSKVIIGLRYRSQYDTLPFDMGMPDLAQTPKNKRVSDLAIAFRASMGGSIFMGGKEQAVFQLGATPLDAAPALFDGVRNVFPPGSEDTAQISYVNDTAWPATITAIFPEYEV